MNKKDKNIKVKDAVVGKFYRIDVDKDTTIWESQFISKFDGVIVEYLGKLPDSNGNIESPYPYTFRLIMGTVESVFNDRRNTKKPGDTIRLDLRDSLTLKKL